MSRAASLLYSAVIALCDTGSIQERMINACVNYLIYLEKELEDLPGKIRKGISKRYSNFMQRVTRELPRDNEGKIQATINEMNAEQISKLVEEVIDMFYEVAMHEEDI